MNSTKIIKSGVKQLKHPGGFSSKIYLSLILCAAFIFLALSASTILHAEEQEHAAPVEILPNTIEYYISNSEDISQGKKWHPISKMGTDQLLGHNEILLRFRYPEIKWGRPALLLIGYLGSLEVWEDQKKIYSTGKAKENLPYVSDNEIIYAIRHIIPLAPDKVYAGYVLLRVPYEDIMDIGSLEKIYIGDLQDINTLSQSEEQRGLRLYIPLMCLGGTLLFTGIFFLGLFLFPLKKQNYPFISFGFFCLVSGLSYLNVIPVHAALGLSPKIWIVIETTISFLLPVGILAFVEYTFVSSLGVILRRLWQFQLLLALVSAIWLQVGLMPDFLNEFGDIVALVSVILSITSIYRSSPVQGKEKYKTRITVAGLLIFMITAFIDILNNLGILSFGGYYYGFGTLILMLSLGYTLLVHYRETILQVNQYALELEIDKGRILKLEQTNLQARFEALKNQLNPHFLFNTLGTLMTLIEEDSRMALDYVEKLSRVYRYLLKTKDRGLVRLEEELEFIRSYAGLVSGRFGSGFQVNISIPASFNNYSIPPLGLQLLLENALKHNSFSAESPLKVDIYIEADNFIIAKNNRQPKQVHEKSSKIGLKTLDEQYSFFTDKKVSVYSDDFIFTAKIPLLKIESESL